ncbi:kinase-like domain-containing protein [Phyllosticta paracitricarpa]
MSCKLFQKCPGGFNYCFALRFEDGLQWIFRFPLPKSSMLPQRKTEAELAVMQFIREKTSIPVPKVIASGVTEGEFEKLGPYILMEFVEGELLSELLLDFDDENQRMRKDIEESTLRHIYSQVAGFYLELFAHEFSAIGSLEMECLESGNAWRAASEPLTFELNETQRMMVAAEIPVPLVSSSPFTSTSEYFEHLAFQTLTSLAENKTTRLYPQEAFQNFNTAYLLRSIAQHFAAKIEGMPHKLYCDDLRFGNIIVNDSYDILAIIDFEFTYAAPASFLGSPPWWLAGTEPFEWNDHDKKDYEAKMDMFIDELEQEETARNDHAHALSRFMRQCWANGFFWYNVAVRESVKLPQVMMHCLHIEPFRSFLQKPAWDAEDDFDTIMLALECMKIKPGE